MALKRPTGEALARLLADITGHVFRDFGLMQRALTHSSARGASFDNERLEFLGDRVLGLVVTDMLASRSVNAAQSLVEFVRRLAGVADITYNTRVAQSEISTSSRNAAMAHFMKSFGNLHNKVGEVLQSGADAEIKAGNCLPLRNIPLGTNVHNVELIPGRASRVARSAGSFCQLMAKEGDYAQLRLPSGEVRSFHANCRAVVGQVGNLDHENISYGKAGRRRWLGRLGKVRGVAMNPVDHPMGGGEGKSSGGRHPCTPWGVPTKGHKTRHNRRTDKNIVKRRGKGR